MTTAFHYLGLSWPCELVGWGCAPAFLMYYLFVYIRRVKCRRRSTSGGLSPLPKYISSSFFFPSFSAPSFLLCAFLPSLRLPSFLPSQTSINRRALLCFFFCYLIYIRGGFIFQG